MRSEVMGLKKPTAIEGVINHCIGVLKRLPVHWSLKAGRRWWQSALENEVPMNESLGFGAALHARHWNRYMSAAAEGDKPNLVRGHELGRIHPLSVFQSASLFGHGKVWNRTARGLRCRYFQAGGYLR